MTITITFGKFSCSKHGTFTGDAIILESTEGKRIICPYCLWEKIDPVFETIVIPDLS